jgi:pilus assembly protein FimV
VGKAISVAILAAALSLAALVAHAAGLGRITVHSPLGQPLNAEIEIVALAPGEEESLVARVAPPDAYAQAGIEPTAILNTMRFSIERRDGRRFVRVTTQQAVNDPFVELLIELQWSTGKLVREYTFLLDPPEYRARELATLPPVAPKPAAPVAPPAPPAEIKPAPPPPTPPAAEAKPAPAEPIAPVPTAPAPVAESTPPPVTETKPPAAAVEAKPLEPMAAEPPKEAPAPPAQEPAQEPAKEAAAEPAQPAIEEPKTHEVVKGDTLGAIAKANLPPGVSLNQMLIAIYRANQDAFIRENVNWVRAGRILHIPPAEAIGTVDADEANRLVRAHMAEFREYRAKLAAAPASADTTPGQREPGGTIEPKPEPPKPAAPQDQVRLSKVDPQKPSAAARGDDLVARERALQEAQSRIKDLEKNVADLQKLLELRNQQLAELQNKATPAKPEAAKPAPAPVPAPVAKAPEAPKPAPAPAAPAPTPAKPEAPKPEAAKPEAPKPEAPKPAPKPVAKPASPPPPPEPSLIDEFLDNPVALAGLGGVLLLLIVYAYWAWRKKKAAHAKFHDSVVGAAAAGASTTGSAAMAEPTLPPASTTASQPPASGAPAAVAADEVDPIAEADVYMAYGRDAQAEEILKEALQKDASRIAVHAKLLEIYAKRQDTKSFEQTAVKLKSLTDSNGPEWEKAAALGRSIDPQNGLYAAAGGAAAAAAVAEAPSAPAAPAPTLDFDIGGAGQASASSPDLTLDAAPKAGDTGLDFDVSGATQTQKKDVSVEETVVASGQEKSAGGGLDFNLDLGTPSAAPEEKKPEPAPSSPAAPAADAGLSFDLNLDLGGTEQKAEEKPAAPATDLSAISLDLGSPDTTAAAPAGTDPKWQEIATKLDLAKAYEEMGDKNGARELLNEVMKDGDPAQKGQAEQLLAKLG